MAVMKFCRFINKNPAELSMEFYGVYLFHLNYDSQDLRWSFSVAGQFCRFLSEGPAELSTEF